MCSGPSSGVSTAATSSLSRARTWRSTGRSTRSGRASPGRPPCISSPTRASFSSSRRPRRAERCGAAVIAGGMTSPSLRDRLGHDFRRPELLHQALTHRSYGAQHNERLEFVGDAVLDCAIAVALYERFPDSAEGDLSRVRANLVNRDTLARLAGALDLGAYVRLGEG